MRRTLLAAFLAAVFVAAAGVQAQAESCMPFGKEKALLGKYFTYEAKDPRDGERQLTITFAAVAPSEAGGAIWCQYGGRVEEKGRFLFATKTDANGVQVAQLLPKPQGGFREYPASEAEIACARRVGRCAEARPRRLLACEKGELVIRFEAAPGRDQQVIRYRYREDGVLTSLRAEFSGDPVRETRLVAEGAWTGPNCLSEIGAAGSD